MLSLISREAEIVFAGGALLENVGFSVAAFHRAELKMFLRL